MYESLRRPERDLRVTGETWESGDGGGYLRELDPGMLQPVGREDMGPSFRPRGLTDAAAAGRVEQEAVGAHAGVPAMRVRTLPMLAAPSCRALIHICEGWGGPSGVRGKLPASPAPKAKLLPPLPKLTFAGPINPFKTSWTRPIWGARLVGVTCGERR